jgi:hypothetical protein
MSWHQGNNADLDRRCERSEAIQRYAAALDRVVAALLAMTISSRG